MTTRSVEDQETRKERVASKQALACFRVRRLTDEACVDEVLRLLDLLTTAEKPPSGSS